MFSRVGGLARSRATAASSMSEPLVLMERMKPISVKRSYRGQKSGQSGRYGKPGKPDQNARPGQNGKYAKGPQGGRPAQGKPDGRHAVSRPTAQKPVKKAGWAKAKPSKKPGKKKG